MRLNCKFVRAGDRPSNLVGTVLLHEVETSDDDAIVIREAARQFPDSARDEYTGLRVDKELRQRRCVQPRGVGGNPAVEIGRLARQRLTAPLFILPSAISASTLPNFLATLPLMLRSLIRDIGCFVACDKLCK